MIDYEGEPERSQLCCKVLNGFVYTCTCIQYTCIQYVLVPDLVIIRENLALSSLASYSTVAIFAVGTYVCY